MKHTLQQAIAATDLELCSLHDFWKKYDIYKAEQNLTAAAWNVQNTAMNGVWKKTMPKICE